MREKTATSTVDPGSWVDEHGDVLYRFAVLRVKDPHVAEDLVQETLVSALQGLERFKSGSTVRTWLIGILKHKIVDHFRKTARELPAPDLAGTGPDAEEGSAIRLTDWGQRAPAWDNPDKALENKEFWAAFRHCLDAMPESARRAFTLREMDGLTTEEICKILDITATNLWVILHRARGRLRNCLETTWFGAEGPSA